MAQEERSAIRAREISYAPDRIERLSPSGARRRLPFVLLLLCVLLSLNALAGAKASWGAQTHDRAVIVRAAPGGESCAQSAVTRLGGRVGMQLRIIHGFEAHVSPRAIAAVRRVSCVVTVTPDAVVRPEGATYSPATDTGSIYNTTLMTGAQAYWKAGFTGKGVDVALIDSGVVGVDGLALSGKIVNGADLSFESQASNLRYLDTFGHGTHMAGIIAGRASAATAGKYPGDSAHFLGVAPDARIVSVKVADAHGATDVSQVIAGIDWVVQHRSDNGMNIRVLNLSYGTDTSQQYAEDPLAYAAEQAWQAGIVVVAAAGNAGFAKGGSMTDPAYDPFVLSVGASNTNGTNSYADDTVADFSSNGLNGSNDLTQCTRTVDLIAPGTHIVSLRAPGSYVDVNYGSTGLVGSTFFRGSGTSQATAVVSGAAALILQQRPTITPDQLKKLLAQTATKLSFISTSQQGAGEVNLATALSTATPTSAPQNATPSTGTGSLDASRGSTELQKDGVTLSGEMDIFGAPFDSVALAGAEALRSSWSGGTWNKSSWSGSSWSGSSWTSTVWTKSSWSGTSWSSTAWSKSSWSRSSWSGDTWLNNNWLKSSWSDDVWADAGWN
jgi:serine protease AprX